MSATITLWLPVLFLANIVALLWVLISKRATTKLPLRNKTNLARHESKTSQHQPVLAITLVWRNVHCVVGTGPNQQTVLHLVSGRACHGEITVLMGPSGAGKSTLLDVLSQRKTTGTITGEILLNNQHIGRSFRKQSAYIPQDDNFIPSLSCVETLEFYAGLLLYNWSTKDRKRRVQEVLNDLDLVDQQHTLVGGILPGGIRVKGLSGGQKRRLNVAIGIISAPSVVFMDELTTGLDSFTALSIMRFVKDLALKKQHSIITTIHQPRPDIWNLFSRVTLLSKGMLIFEGKRERAMPWFTTQLGFTYNQEIDGTFPEWCLDLISIDFKKEPSICTIRIMDDLKDASENFLNAYDTDKGVTRVQPNDDLANELSLSETSINLETPKSSIIPASNHDPSSSFDKQPASKFFFHFLMLSWRCLAFITRNPADVGGRLFTISFVATFLGAVFYNLSDGPESVATRFNVLFMSALVLVLFPYLSVSHATADKAYYYSDVSSKLYSPFVYYLARTLVQLPFQIINAVVFILVVYGMTGLREDTKSLLHYLIVLTLAYLIFSQILNLAAILAPSEDLTFMIGVCFVAFNLMFSDFFIRKDQMKFQWLGYCSKVSPMKYIFEALTYIEFKDRDFYTPCVEDFENSYDALSAETRALLPFPKAVVSYALQGMSDENGLCLISGNGFLQILGNQRPVWTTAVILLGFLTALHFFTFTTLYLLSRNPVKR